MNFFIDNGSNLKLNNLIKLHFQWQTHSLINHY